MEDRPALFFRFQMHEVFRIKKARGVGSVIGATHLARTLSDFRERAKNNARLVRQADAFTGPGARSESAANPKRTFVQMRKEFRADNATKREIDGHHPPKKRRAHHHKPLLDCPSHGVSISRFQEFHNWVAPSTHSLPE